MKRTLFATLALLLAACQQQQAGQPSTPLAGTQQTATPGQTVPGEGKAPLKVPTFKSESVKLVKKQSGAEVFVSDAYDDPVPKRVAVLPFRPKGDDKIGARVVNQTFRNHFSQLPFGDIEWYALERAMLKLGLDPFDEVPEDRLADLAAEVGADAVVTGRVLRYDTRFLGIAGEIGAGVDVAMVRASDGKMLWRGRHTVTHYKGKIPLSAIEAVVAIITTAMSLDEKAKIVAVEEMGRDIVKEFPIVENMEQQVGVRIVAAAHDARARPVRAGEPVRFAAQLDTEGRVRVQVGNDVSLVLEPEKGKKNLYSVVYRFRPGQDLEAGTVSFIAFDSLGNRAEYLDPFAPLVVDTVAPNPASGLRSRFAEDGMKLAWGGTDSKDVIGYEVYRSATPLTGFEKIGETEFTEFTDDAPLAELGHYYIKARDRAGNLSERTEIAVARMIRPGPTPVSGGIDDDTTWFAAASPYVVDGTVQIAGNITLTIEPGTEVQVMPGGKLIVRGQVLARGDAGGIITWTGEGDQAWDGIVIENSDPGRESVFAHNRISGASTGLTLVAASPEIENVTVLRSDVGLKIADFAAPKLTGNTLRGNRIGLIVDTADPVIEANVIRQNTEIGVDVIAATPVIVGNDLSGNGELAVRVRKQAKGGIVLGEKNWWGEVSGDAVRGRFKGAVSFFPFLDGPPPDGKPVKFSAASLAGGAAQISASDGTPQADIEDKVFDIMLEAYEAMDEGAVLPALKKLKQVAPFAAQNPELQYRLSLLMFATSDYAGALRAIDKAIGLNAFDSNFFVSRGMILRAVGEADEAVKAFQQALKLNAKNRTAQQLLNGG